VTTTVASEPFLFAPPDTPSESVDQARHEISQILREVAATNRGGGTRDRYVRFLADRILRAMAAHGVVVWHVPENANGESPGSNPDDWYRYVVEHRIGTVTDQQFDETAVAVHDRLLLEIAGQNSPVVVPPTPGASEPDVPANPTEYPAAMVPVCIDSGSALPTLILEVFLEPGGSPGSQRGALRFLAQMGDLAGEFLRADQLRCLQRRLLGMDACSKLVEQLNRKTSTRKIQTAWVDGIASLLDCPRVALCRVDRGKPQIVAVSHVERIDQLSDAAEAIRRAATTPLPSATSLHNSTTTNPSTFAFATLRTDRRAGPDRRSEETNETQSDRPTVIPILVVAPTPGSRWRLVLFETTENVRQDSTPSTDRQRLLQRLLVGGDQAWTAAHRVEAIPGGRWWSRLTAADDDDTSDRSSSQAGPTAALVSSLRRRLGLIFAIVLTTTLLMCLPIPAVVPVTGVIRPLELDTYHAASDASVQTLHVHHGQSVQRGDVLARLTSRDLAERKSTLLGRRAVLMQRRDQFKQSIMASNQSSIHAATWSNDQEMDEEIDAIDRQLHIIADSESDLVLLARRDGRVDAWRLHERLAGRPLRRGDVVLSVIAEDTTWVVDATIPQRRVSRVERAIADDVLSADVSTRWSPEDVRTATAHCFGPVVTDPVDGTPGVVLRLSLSQPPRLGEQPLAEMPARIAIRCGRMSVGWFLLEDVAHWLQTRVGVYL